MDYFQSEEGGNWTPEQAAGIVGNLVQESGDFDPLVISGKKTGDKGKAVGAAQWHLDRQKKFHKVYGKPLKGSSLEEQLAFISHELNTTEQGAAKRLREAKDERSAADVVQQFYERSAGHAKEKRRNHATELLASFTGGGENVFNQFDASEANPFDQFDAQAEANPFDQFDKPAEPDFEGISKAILDKFNAGSLSDEQLDAFTELNTRGFFSDPMSVADLGGAKLGEPAKPKQPEQDIVVPEWAKDHPNLFGAYGAGKAVLEKVVTPAVEGAGLAVGSMFSPVLGTALGYGITKKGMAIVEEVYAKLGGEEGKQRTIPDEMLKTAVDVGSTMGVQKAFMMAGPALETTGKYLFDKLPRRLYSSAVKLPTSKKWVQTLPGKEISKRLAATEEGLRSRVPPSEFGMAKVKSLEKEVRHQVDKATKILSQNPEAKLKVEDILNSGLKKAYAQAKTSSDPVGQKAAVDKIKAAFKEHGEYITPENANAIKRTLYKEVHWGDAVDPITATSKKGIAKDIMFKLEDLYPELRKLNEIDAARISLLEGIEKSVGREANKSLVGLSTKVLASHPKTWPLAIWDATIGHPQIKARIAFALARANPDKFSRFIYPEMPPGYFPTKVAKVTGVYRYDPKFKGSKSTTPKELKTTQHPAEAPSTLRKKSDIAIEREEARRVKALEQVFKEAERKKGLIGPPLIKRGFEGTKSTIPPSVEDRLKGLDI